MQNNVHIPLFETDGLTVKVDRRRAPGVLCRSAQVDDKLASVTDTVVAGFQRGVEGMLYCLYTLESSGPAPVYIGIAMATGHSARLSSLFRSARKKPRFDDYDGYHIGDLSTQVIPGYAGKKANKKVWADRLFVNAPSMRPELRLPVYFWGKDWSQADKSAIPSLGHTSLLLEERILIDALNAAYPGQLLNC
jgi:hypothetical protein